MHPKKRIPTHPGKVLLEEFLVPMEITQVELAAHIGVPCSASTRSCAASAGSPRDSLAVLPGPGHHPEFWINLQAAHDLAAQRPSRQVKRLRKTG